MLTPSITTLPSGIELIRIPMPATPSVTTLLLGNTGSRYEADAKQGIAHFFEHMVFKGTAKYPDAQTLAVAVDALGAQSNAFTSKEYTGYYIKSASRHLETALDILTDMIFNPLLKQEDIDRERGVIIEEINMYEDTPMQSIGNIFDQLLFAGTGLEHDIIGTKQTVSGLQRADFLDLLTAFYQPSNLSLVVAGAAEVVGAEDLPDRIEQLVDLKLATATLGKITQTERFVPQTALSAEASFSTGARLRVKSKQTEQAHLMLGWPGLKRSDPRRYALSLLTVVLGGNMSSRLFSEVREKRGLCYYVHADTDYFHNTGSVAAAAGVDPSRIDEALAVIKEECLKLGSGALPVTDAELVRAQEYAIGSLQLSLEDSRSVAQFFGIRQLLLRQTETPEEVIAHLREVTPDDVKAVAKDMLTETDIRLALIGPFEQQQFKKFVAE